MLMMLHTWAHLEEALLGQGDREARWGNKPHEQIKWVACPHNQYRPQAGNWFTPCEWGG